jgi:hypothetical protein
MGVTVLMRSCTICTLQQTHRGDKMKESEGGTRCENGRDEKCAQNLAQSLKKTLHLGDADAREDTIKMDVNRIDVSWSSSVSIV